jgi:hypothetical protein
MESTFFVRDDPFLLGRLVLSPSPFSSLSTRRVDLESDSSSPLSSTDTTKAFPDAFNYSNAANLERPVGRSRILVETPLHLWQLFFPFFLSTSPSR